MEEKSPSHSQVVSTMSADKASRLRLELLIVAAVCAFLFFYGLGNFGLVGADEPRYAQIAREMLQRHDFITPTINGEAWLEKPVLYYWLGMASFKVFGVSDAAARLPSATLAFAMVLAIFFYMRRFRPGAELNAALITASSAAVFAFSRGASTDMPLGSSFTIAMLGWYAWHQLSEKKWLLLFYFLLGLATLAKGPVAPFLAGLIVLVFCVVQRDIKVALRTLWLPGFLLYLIVVLPWFVAVQIKNPQFLYVFILEHNLARFRSNMFHHRQPLWYYIPVLLLAVAPWTFFAVPALVDGIRSTWRNWRSPAQRAFSRETTHATGGGPDSFSEFLTLWTLLPILFFSLSQSKLPGYILPSIPPCAILTADYLRRREHHPLSAFQVLGHGLLIGTLAAFALAFPPVFIQHVPMPMRSRYFAGLLALASCLIISSVLRRNGTRMLRLATLVPVILIVGFILRVAAPTIDDYYSARPVAHELARRFEGNKPVAVYDARRELRYGLNFYRDQNIPNYNDNEVPPGAHLLVGKSGSLPALSALLRGRQVLRVGGFSPQRVDYFLVSPYENLSTAHVEASPAASAQSAGRTK